MVSPLEPVSEKALAQFGYVGNGERRERGRCGPFHGFRTSPVVRLPRRNRRRDQPKAYCPCADG